MYVRMNHNKNYMKHDRELLSKSLSDTLRQQWSQFEFHTAYIWEEIKSTLDQDNIHNSLINST